MLMLFTAALLVVVAVITVVDAVGSFWVLVPVMLFIFAVTFVVIAGINRLLSDDDAERWG
jgi:hypothetical protein